MRQPTTRRLKDVEDDIEIEVDHFNRPQLVSPQKPDADFGRLASNSGFLIDGNWRRGDGARNLPLSRQVCDISSSRSAKGSAFVDNVSKDF